MSPFSQNQSRDFIERVFVAQKRLQGVIYHTNLCLKESLILKREDQQLGGSFKIRGVANLVFSAMEYGKVKGVTTVSTGNTALACATLCKSLDLEVTIFTTKGAPAHSLQLLQEMNAQVVECDVDFSTLAIRAQEMAKEQGHLFCSPGVGASFIEGVGTLGIEILDAIPHVDNIVVPVGGGGLATAIGLVCHSMRPGSVKVYGVQMEGSPFVFRWYNGLPPPERPSTIVRSLSGDLEADAAIFRSGRNILRDVLLVSDQQAETESVGLEKDNIRVDFAAGAAMAASKSLRSLGDDFDQVTCVVLTGAR